MDIFVCRWVHRRSGKWTLPLMRSEITARVVTSWAPTRVGSGGLEPSWDNHLKSHGEPKEVFRVEMRALQKFTKQSSSCL
jgi:hypothetical protein